MRIEIKDGNVHIVYNNGEEITIYNELSSGPSLVSLYGSKDYANITLTDGRVDFATVRIGDSDYIDTETAQSEITALKAENKRLAAIVNSFRDILADEDSEHLNCAYCAAGIAERHEPEA